MPQKNFHLWQRAVELCFALYTLLLVTLTHLPAENLPPTHTSDKVLHFAAYFVWGTLATIAVSFRLPVRWRIGLILLICGAVFASLDEYTQGFVGRYPALDDFLADMIGIAVAIFIVSGAGIIFLNGTRMPIEESKHSESQS